jgi:putative SOS response-associated peptidase YedK
VDLLRPFDAEKMMTWKFGKDVGSVKNNAPELLNQA